MKRFVFLLGAALLLTVQCFAIDIYSDTFKQKNGDTYLGVFDTKSLTDSEKVHLRAFLDSDKTIITYHPNAVNGVGNGIYYLLYYPKAVASTVVIGEDGLAELHFNGTTSEYIVYGTVWSAEDDGTLRYLYDTKLASNGWLSHAVIIGGTAATSIQFPSPVSSYAADYVGTLYLEDNDGLMSEVKPEPDDNGGILGFLSGFWDNLKNTFIGLFIPSDGFFEAWYNDLSKTFSDKLGTIFTLNQQIVSFFNSIDAADSALTVTMDGKNYNVFGADIFVTLLGWIRPIVTGLVILCTWIFCYRKIITMVSE